nr:hypothetical protein [Acidovorax sp.]
MGSKSSNAPAPDPRLVEAQIRSMGIQDDVIKRVMQQSEEIQPLQKEQLQFGLDSARTAYDQSQQDRTWMLDRRGSLTTMQDTLTQDARSFNTEDKANELAGRAMADVNQGFANAEGQQARSLARMTADAPVAKPLSRADVTAARQQAATAIGERIDAMTAQEVQKIAARFLPTMGVKVPAGKARIKAAMADPKVNVQAAADEVGAVLADDVKRALQADVEGRLGDAAEQQSQQDFIPAPDGGLDYGEITPEMGKAMRRQAGKIRLRRGDETQGLVHIENRHAKDFAALGFNSTQDFVSQVASGFTKIYKGRGAALDVVLDDQARGMLIVSLEPSADGDFYDIKTATPIRRDQFKNEEPLWDRAGPSASTADEGSPPYPKGQNGADSVPPTAPAAQPDTPKLTPAEAKSLMAWEDLGQKDGVKTHALTFYESQADKDAKRGRMIVAKVSKGDRSATAWMVDGEDKTFGMLAQAKKLAEEVGMAKAVADGFVEQAIEAPKSTAKPAAPATTSAPIEDAGAKIGGARKAQEDGAKEREAAKSAKRRAERAKDSTETGLRVGIAPGSADPVTVRDGTVYVGKYEAVNYDTGEPVTVPKGSTGEAVAQALKDAGALSSRQRLFGLGEMGDAVMFSRATTGLTAQDAVVMFNQATHPNPYPHKLQATLAAAKHGASAVQADNGGWLLAPKAQAYTAQELQDAQQRIDKLNRALKKYNNVTPAAVLSDAPTPAMAWGRSIARTLGYNVTFIQPNPDFHGVAVGGDAFVSASADHPEIGLIGHEVLHSFKQSSPDIYQALAERIRPYLKDGVVDAKRRWEDANGGRNTSMAHAEEEVLADLNGAMWLDPKFWREMAKNDQSLFRQVAYKFMEVATKAMQGLSRFKADSLVTDVDAVREIIAQEWAYQAQEMGNPSEFVASDSPAFSRTESIKTAYEARIDALFKGEKAKAGTRILDSSDIMGLLGYPKVPLILNESHLRDGLTNHPEMTASAWKKVPEWIENPAAAYTDARHPTRLTVIAPETLAGYPVMMVIESKPNPAGSKPAPAVAAESLLVTVYAKTTGGLPPASYLASSGAMKYADTKNAPEIWQRGGGQFPKQAALSQGRHKILSEKHLAGYRRGQAKDSAAVDENPPTMFSRTTAASIASSMGDMTPDQEKAYKNVAGVKAVPTVRERMDAIKSNLGLKLRQGLVDQFAAIKQLDQNAYVQARMSKGTDGTLEAMLMYGKPFMRDGAPDVDVKDGGFAKVLASLKGEQDRWMM